MSGEQSTPQAAACWVNDTLNKNKDHVTKATKNE